MSDIASANDSLAAKMQVALAVEQGPGAASEEAESQPPASTKAALDTRMSESDVPSLSSAHKSELDMAFNTMSGTAKKAVNSASASSRGSGVPDKDKNDEYGLADGWSDVCNIATRLMGWSTGSEDQDEDETENTYQVLQQMLADLQDQSWLIDQEQLSVCVRSDGSDMRLGQGSFGSVYKGVMNKSVAVAIKSIRNPTMRAKMEFVNEMAMLMNLRHQNIVQCLGAVIDRTNLLLVMELMPRGDLYRNLQKDKEGILRWHKRGQAIAMDIVRGVLHMHDLGIVHQDIKSGNVMMSRDFACKIGDVGLAAVFSQPKGSTQAASNPGTLEWTAPEILKGDAASTKADVYSLGIVLWEVLTGEVPERGKLRALRAPGDCPEEIAAIVERCMDSDPDARPTTLELFECLTSHSLPVGRALSERAL
ncbi:hypothetical protein WJX84_007905 [Apatococcus fuscideae]|uniref:Protein kinase domain-containing protein n=1 Tax=Apatococcus fuscideae TaxID=2026836 RepID=A0AAW1SMM0_9CHLO